MENLAYRLGSLRVRDVMNPDVVVVEQQRRMDEIATLFRERRLSMAPVVDDEGRCVGVISATDFLRRLPDDESLPHALEHELVDSDGDGPVRIEPLEQETAAHYMTPAVQSVQADALLLSAARVMCGGHFHRLPVIDRQGRPEGVLSTMDLIAALLNAIEEAELLDAGDHGRV